MLGIRIRRMVNFTFMDQNKTILRNYHNLFDVKLTEEKWQMIYPVSKVYKDNARNSKTS